jgi:hypothetical protein
MIIKYENPPSSEELIVKAKQALANIGYDTPKKRKQWYEENCKFVVWICNGTSQG